MNLGLGRRSSRCAAALLVALSITGCASEAPERAPAEVAAAPWDEPVAGAAEATEWRDDGRPVTPFGPDGPGSSSPDELLESMARALAEPGGYRTTARVTGQNASGTVLGGIRLDLLAAGGNVIAADLQVEMRNDGGSWTVASVRSREHCAVALVAGACP